MLATCSTMDDHPTSIIEDGIGLYLRDVGRHSLMTIEQERDRAKLIVELRAEYWRCILAYHPFAETISATILTAGLIADSRRTRGELVDEVVRGCGEIVSAVESIRRRERKASYDTFAETARVLAAALGDLDRDRIVASAIAKDVRRIVSGQEPKHLVVRLRVHGRPFARYVESIDKAESELIDARDRFALANLRLVVRIASRLKTYQDLQTRIQEGNAGLLKAVDRFDVYRGFRFSTYASWWILHSIRRGDTNHGRQIRIPAHLLDAQRRIIAVENHLSTRTREPTDDEIAAVAGICASKVADVRRRPRVSVSTDEPISFGSDNVVADFIEDPGVTPLECIELRDRADHARSVLDILPTRQQDIMRLRFGFECEPQTLRDIGLVHNLSRERIRQIVANGILTLRGRVKRRA